jgi:solute carrier family 25 carnitine/acylcarnitine transporter 20/29
MNQWFADFLAGSISGILGTLIGHPLDTVKCRLQVASKEYSSTLVALAKTVREERILGLFKGVVPPVLNQFPVNAMYYVINVKDYSLSIIGCLES